MKTLRNRLIWYLAARGWRKATLARLFGLTRARIYQVLGTELRQRREKPGR